MATKNNDQAGTQAMEALRETLRERYPSDVRMAKASEIRDSGNPAHYGDLLFVDGVRYGSVLQDLAMAEPFLKGARTAFELALQNGEQTPWERFTVHFGLFAAKELLSRNEIPSDTTHFEIAREALQVTFTEEVFRDAEQRPNTFRTPEFSTHLLSCLAMNAAARRWGLSVDTAPIDRIAVLPVATSFEPMLHALTAILRAPEQQGEVDENYRKQFRAKINARSYDIGLIADMRFSDAYLLALPKEGGRMVQSLMRLMTD